jgi:hypothetical protein
MAAVALVAGGGCGLIGGFDKDYHLAPDGGDPGADAGADADAGGAEPVVPCGASGADCAPGQLCCFDSADFVCDHCSFSDDCTTATCTGRFTTLKCNDTKDCDADQRCCITFDIVENTTYPVKSRCRADCLPDEAVSCSRNVDCAPDGGDRKCVQATNYPGYKGCL